MKFRHLKSAATACAVLVLASSPLFFPSKSYAIPAFARQYQTSCATCHVGFPKLNDFGKAFKDAGFKFPVDDETNLKSPPVLLGAEAQKQAFPNAIWPGQIPGLPPIGLRMNNFLQFTGNNRNRFNSLAAPLMDVVVPLLQAAVPPLQDETPIQAFAVEVSHHVRRQMLGVTVEGVEHIAFLLPRAADRTFLSAAPPGEQEQALLHGALYVNAAPAPGWEDQAQAWTETPAAPASPGPAAPVTVTPATPVATTQAAPAPRNAALGGAHS
jgi:hypothetical protein